MNNQQTTKKTNWGMIILILILIPILILATMFGLKYLNNDSNNSNNNNIPQQQNSNFPQNNTSNQPTQQPQQTSNTNSQNNSNTSIDFVKTFEGKLDNKYEVMMKITANNGVINGTYYYKSVGKDLTVKGNIDSRGNVSLDEYDEKGNLTGTFEGTMINGNKIEGTWKKPNGNNSMPFYLIESNSNYNSNKQNSSSSSSTANVRGKWSSEGDTGAPGKLVLDLTMSGSKFSGTAEYQDYNSGTRSGICDIDGSFNGNNGTFKLISSNGSNMGSGSLTKEGNKLKFTSNSSFFPSKIYVYKK